MLSIRCVTQRALATTALLVLATSAAQGQSNRPTVPPYSARSVELNRHVWTSGSNDESDSDEITFRVSELGSRSGFVTGQYGQTVFAGLGAPAEFEAANPASTEVFVGTRMVGRGNRLRLDSDAEPLWGDQDLSGAIDSIMVGPQIGVSSNYRVGRFTFGSRLSYLLGYQDGDPQVLGFIGEQPIPSHPGFPVQSLWRNFTYSNEAEFVAHTFEAQLSADYAISENAKLSLGYANLYLSSVFDSFPRLGYRLNYAGNVLGFGTPPAESELWLDSLQLSLIVTR